MEEFFNRFVGFLEGMSVEQLLWLLLGIIVFIAILNGLKRVIIATVVIGCVLLAINFINHELYEMVMVVVRAMFTTEFWTQFPDPLVEILYGPSMAAVMLF